MSLTAGNIKKIIADNSIADDMPLALQVDDGEITPVLDQVTLSAVTTGGGKATPIILLKGYTKAKRQELRQAATVAAQLDDEDEDGDEVGDEEDAED